MVLRRVDDSGSSLRSFWNVRLGDIVSLLLCVGADHTLDEEEEDPPGFFFVNLVATFVDLVIFS